VDYTEDPANVPGNYGDATLAPITRAQRFSNHQRGQTQVRERFSAVADGGQLVSVVLVPLAELPTAGIGQAAVRVAVTPAVGVLLLTTAVLLAVSKPWGKPDSAAAEPGATLPSRSQHVGPDRDLHGPLACRR
jgi:hypothetical protein